MLAALSRGVLTAVPWPGNMSLSLRAFPVSENLIGKGAIFSGSVGWEVRGEVAEGLTSRSNSLMAPEHFPIVSFHFFSFGSFFLTAHVLPSNCESDPSYHISEYLKWTFLDPKKSRAQMPQKSHRNGVENSLRIPIDFEFPKFAANKISRILFILWSDSLLTENCYDLLCSQMIPNTTGCWKDVSICQ